MIAFDHVTGAHPSRFEGHDVGFESPPYIHVDEFHEPFVLFSYLAGLTKTLNFATSILILPQRQTALVAKQAAALQILSAGRFSRKGIGTGWNFTEYEALGEDFHNRGARQAEQVEVLRRLWTEPLVTFNGRWHKLDNEGIAPLPPKPIEIWFGGGSSEPLLRRIANLADGWIPGLSPGEDLEATVSKVHAYMREAGRDPKALGLQGNVRAAEGGPAEWVASAKRWQGLGATHLGLGGLIKASPAELLALAIKVKSVVQPELG
jgi:probable F420-dependent oxidoreductase